MSELNPMFAAVELIPDASPEQWATWERIITEQAPDLADMLGVGQ